MDQFIDQDINGGSLVPVRLFRTDIARTNASEFQRCGYVLIRDAVDPDFLDYAIQEAESVRRTSRGSPWDIKDKKWQALFELPADGVLLDDMLRSVSSIAGIPLESVRLSERHLKFYEPQALAQPAMHKDRLASQVAIGIPLQVPSDSRLVLFPMVERVINVYDSAAELRASFDDGDTPEARLEGSEPVSLATQKGDAAIFVGSEIYHERLNAPGAVVLYLKFSGAGLDPLGEDPRTIQQRQYSLATLPELDDDALWHRWIQVSPRLQQVVQRQFRLNWVALWQAVVGGEGVVPLTPDDVRLVQNLKERCTILTLVRRVEGGTANKAELFVRIKRLVRRGVLDILAQ